MEVIRTIVTIADVALAFIIWLFTMQNDYKPNPVSNTVFGMFILAFGLSAVLMWR